MKTKNCTINKKEAILHYIDYKDLYQTVGLKATMFILTISYKRNKAILAWYFFFLLLKRRFPLTDKNKQSCLP